METGIVVQMCCALCDQRATWRVPGGNLRLAPSYMNQAKVWADTHKVTDGHDRFYLVSTNTSFVLVDDPGPDADVQLLLAEDPLYETFHLGEPDG